MGNARLFRRFRRFAPYPIIGTALYLLDPMQMMGTDSGDQLLDWLGLLVAFAGEAVRFWTWGANAVAGHFTLRTNGPYKLLRHPLYVGNFLIVVGMLMIFNNPIAYLIVIPAFVTMYAIITRREEHQILGSSDLGPGYAEYMRVHRNRFLPQLEHWRAALTPAHSFRWWFAVEKEYEAVLGILLGWLALDFLEERVVWSGISYGETLPTVQVVVLFAVAVAAPLLWLLKKRRKASMHPGPA